MNLPISLLAVEIGGTKLQICAGNSEGEIFDRRRFAIARERGAEGIQEMIAGAVPELVARWKPAAIGVGYGGPVDWRTGRIERSYHIGGWSNFPMAQWLGEKAGVPVFVENDANVAALGEALRGAGKGREPVFYTTLGSGVGGGLIIEGRIYHGAAPSEMEFGHLRLNSPDRILEDDCSGWSIDGLIRAGMERCPESLLLEMARRDPGCESRHLCAALAQGDALAAEIFETMSGHLAKALGVVGQLLHPEVIILGGGVSLMGEPLRAAVEKKLAAWLMDVFRPGPRVLLAALREDAVPVGALLLAAARLGA